MLRIVFSNFIQNVTIWACPKVEHSSSKAFALGIADLNKCERSSIL